MSNTLDKIAEVPQRLIAPEPLPTLILGGGFTGLFTALHLSHQQYTTPTILIDREWNFIFKPLLYEFLSGEMNIQFIRHRYDDLLHKSGIAFIRDEVQSIDLQKRQVSLASGLHYTYSNLVLSLGSVAGYFGVKGARENALAFRTSEDAIALAWKLRDCLQQATQTSEPQQKKSLLTIAILGAGCTGVELAATLADLLPDWYSPLGGDIADIRIVVIQRGKQILKGDSDRLRQTAQEALQKRTISVDVMLETSVIEIRPNVVVLKRNNRINDQIEELAAATIIWTTGIVINPLIDTLSLPEGGRDKQGRLKLTDTLQLIDFPEVFAGGDCTVMEHPLPATAQVAYQQGAAIAHNLQALSEGHSPIAFEVGMRGTLMKLGLSDGVAEIYDRYEVKGNLGHLIRQAAYLQLLPTPARNFKATIEWLSDEMFHCVAGL
ncbi:NAD(P)/FAD-dependent oxidoreductase [Pseudanabaena sp. BC1403]|uniref:NAD(P)/FAD-dependent oxidoreductase n=1 Tax=Pseudanabaena sp. BC1403 TaxID=2043171 RepID=UPI000CD929D3|nr:NAD(P)/FAD-dependent oxidoreductase [Pseudanabaena sp. BC1403]